MKGNIKIRVRQTDVMVAFVSQDVTKGVSVDSGQP